MTTNLISPILQILFWSVIVTVCINHLIPNSNPFLELVFCILLFFLVVTQLIFLKKHGVIYVGIFLLSLIILTVILLYLDNQIFDSPKRYYDFG